MTLRNDPNHIRDSQQIFDPKVSKLMQFLDKKASESHVSTPKSKFRISVQQNV